MAYADYQFYAETYKGSLSETDFNKFVNRAAMDIDKFTFQRAATAPDEMQLSLKYCNCELAETLQKYNAQDTATVGGLISAESVDGYSVSYKNGTSSEMEKEAERHAVKRAVCLTWLTDPVNLMYTGVQRLG